MPVRSSCIFNNQASQCHFEPHGLERHSIYSFNKAAFEMHYSEGHMAPNNRKTHFHWIATEGGEEIAAKTKPKYIHLLLLSHIEPGQCTHTHKRVRCLPHTDKKLIKKEIVTQSIFPPSIPVTPCFIPEYVWPESNQSESTLGNT